jgi:hypothetical protein
MQNHSINHFEDACRIINLYYKDPVTVMEWVRNNKTPFKKERVKKAEKADKKTRKSAGRTRPAGGK